ncbi:HET-domain-containing protein [Trichodelitschia bisporula]|uniref:HET-domain-containing protein n=1 Tax=Trichodelitschia bisporula TaxID=703511 RepID=A0A6G1IBE5_9PEZI|nr:HET-domain-containing protein [Trichodelitschia bisporula]
MLCRKCQEFAAQALSSSDQKPGEPFVWPNFSFSLHHADELKRCAEARCLICLNIWHSLWPHEVEKLTDESTVTLELKPDQNMPNLRASFADISGQPLFQPRTTGMFYGWADSVQKGLPEVLQECAQLPNENTGSEASFRMADFWMQECCTGHKNCPKPFKDGFIPSRVIDVGSETEDPRLVDTRTPDFKPYQKSYVALSHRWGLTPTLTTKSDTLADRMNGIPLNEIPKVFRDAVLVTRRMRERYLWIDSLCIIQDSKEDWQAESVQMCNIYKKAAFTIASAHSPDSMGGLFRQRNGLRIMPFEVAFAYISGEKRALFIPMGIPEVPWDVQDLPLYSRGWTLQELVLSPRTLIFDPDCLRWECLTTYGSERNPEKGIMRHSSDIRDIQIAIFEEHGANSTSNACFTFDSDTLCSLWHSVVQEYMARELTQYSDRLVAIAGVAEAVGGRIQSLYTTGLWKEHYHRELLWYLQSTILPNPAMHTSVHIHEQADLPKRASPTTAPSWSWASFANRITFYPFSKVHPACELVNLSTANNPHDPSGSITLRADTRIMHVHNQDPGIVAEAVRLFEGKGLRYNAPDRKVPVRLMDLDTMLLLTSKAPRFRSSVCAVPGQWMPDEMISPQTPVTFVAIATTPKLNRRGVYRQIVHALAVLPTEKDDEFRRVGYAEIYDCAWFGYDCAEDLELRKPSWEQLGKRMTLRGRIRPHGLADGKAHRHPIMYDPLPEQEAYHTDAGMLRREITIV